MSTQVEQQLALPLGRPCVTCTHPDRLAIEQEIAEGTPLRTIADRHDVARSSVRRHLTAHMEVDAETSARLGLDPESLAVRVYEVAERARDIATDALDAGSLAVALRAGDAELRALAALAGLGVRDEGRVVEYDMFRVTSHAVVRAARRDERVANAVAAQLDIVDEQGIADDIRAQFTPASLESSS